MVQSYLFQFYPGLFLTFAATFSPCFQDILNGYDPYSSTLARALKLSANSPSQYLSN